MFINRSIITNYTDDTMEKNKKDVEYLDYINKHVNMVKQKFEEIFIPLLDKEIVSVLISSEDLHNAINEAKDKVAHHDDSKFSDDEFDGYRARWYPTIKEKNGDDEYQKLIQEKYDKAWENHYTTNEHHPKHWVNKETGVPTTMSLPAIIEMICDWEAMSARFNTNTLDWYEKDADDEKACFTIDTKALVDELLYNILR